MATRMFGLLAEWRPRWTRRRLVAEQIREVRQADVVIGAVLDKGLKDHRRPPARHRPKPPPMPASNM